MESKYIKNIELLSKHVENFPKISGAKIGAMLAINSTSRIISGNSTKSHTFQSKFSNHETKIFPHAETSVIKMALSSFRHDKNIFKKSTLYICRLAYDNSYKRNLHYALAMPCEGCMRAISVFGIKTIVFTTGNETQPIDIWKLN